MELYLKVRRAHFQDGVSGRQIARDFGVSQKQHGVISNPLETVGSPAPGGLFNNIRSLA